MALDQSALVEVLDVVVGKEPVPSVPSAGSIRLYPSPKVDRRRWQQRRAEPACWTVFRYGRELQDALGLVRRGCPPRSE